MELVHHDGPPVWTDVIEKIQAMRGLSDEELAQRVHATPSDIRNWAMGLGEPEPEQSQKLLALLPDQKDS